VFIESGYLAGFLMVNHCLSLHFAHSTSLFVRRVRSLLPQARHATRSAIVAQVFCFGLVGCVLVTVRRRLRTSTGDRVPALFLIRSWGNLLVSTKSQRARKSMTRFKVFGSIPEVLLRVSADSHFSSGRASQRVSRNIDRCSPHYLVSFVSKVRPVSLFFRERRDIENQLDCSGEGVLR